MPDQIASAPPERSTDGALEIWRGRLPEALGVVLFRRYLMGLAPLSLGTWMQLVALGFLTLKVTGSVTAVGLVGAADGIPAVLLALPAGAAGDRFPRARVLAVASSCLGLTSLGLAVAAGTGRSSLPVLLAGAVLLGSATAFDTPIRQALVADIVSAPQLLGAAAVTGTVGSLTRIIGPAVAGALLGTAGAAVCFAAMAILVLPYLVVLATHRWPAAARAGQQDRALVQLLGGLRWAAQDRAASAALVGGTVLGILGVGYMPYLPVFARIHLHGGGQVLGLMYSAGGVGALIGGVAVSLLSRTLSPPRLLLAAAPVYATSLGLLTTVGSLAAAVPCLGGISLGFLAANTAILATLQKRSPAHLRGRVLALYALGYSGGGPLGTLLYAGLSHLVSLFSAIAVGAAVVGMTLLWAALRLAGAPDIVRGCPSPSEP